MGEIRKRAVQTCVRHSAVGILAIGLLTFAGHQSHINALLVSCLYLVTVTVLSLTGDFLAAVLVSVTAFGCLDYFFVEPLYSFRVSDASDVVALLTWVATALVITRLVSMVRAEARDSRLQRQRLERLYRLAQHLLSLEPAASLETEFLTSFVGVFGVTAVCLFDATSAELCTAGESQGELPGKTRDAYVMATEVNDDEARITVRRLQSGRKVSGAIGFEGLEEPAFTVGPLTALAGTFLDRARALRDASEAAAAAQAEVYRSAVLDALAHEFKTPLATILAAAGGLREVGPLLPLQAEMAETVENEAARLGSLTSRLLRTARLDREEIKPRMEVIDITSLVHQITTQYSNRSLDRRIVRAYRLETVEVLADAELLRLPVSQLIENACKYSQPGSIVTVAIKRQDDLVVVSVTNNRSSIPASERRRIFDRFYRGTDAKRSTSGSGLGLYVARKIAVAHGGALELQTEANAQGGVTFCLKIPSTKDETNHVVAAK
jgi:two-component system sensor histidine kinase KdpD